MITLNELKAYCIHNKEEELSYDTDCIMKLEWTYEKIKNSRFLLYQEAMIRDSYQLVKKHFLLLAEKYQRTESPLQRARILENITESIEIYWEAVDTIIQCSNSSDRQFQQTAPVDTGMRHVSPKVCLYYTKMLNDLVRLLGADEQYAFCVRPSLGSLAEADILFSNLEDPGKVTVIRLPERIFVDINICRIILMHELFHIIPADLRMREERAEAYLKIVCYEITNRLIEGLKLHSEEIEIISQWIFNKPIQKITEIVQQRGVEDRHIFYGVMFRELIVNEIKKRLLELVRVSLPEMINGLRFYCSLSGMMNEEWEPDVLYVHADRWRVVISDNALEYVSGRALEDLCEFYMDIFREGFSDLMTTIILQLNPKGFLDGFSAFSMQNSAWKNRAGMMLRVYCVKNALCSSNVYGWNDWDVKIAGDERQKEIINGVQALGKETSNGHESSDVNPACIQSGNSESCIICRPTLEIYNSFFEECTSRFMNKIKEQGREFEDYRIKYNIGQGMSNLELLYQISLRCGEKTEKTEKVQENY